MNASDWQGPRDPLQADGGAHVLTQWQQQERNASHSHHDDGSMMFQRPTNPNLISGTGGLGASSHAVATDHSHNGKSL